MVISKTGVGVSLPPQAIQKFDAFAAERGQSRSEAIRYLAEIGLQTISCVGDVGFKTILAKIDYTQAGLDFLLTQQAPQEADRIADMITDRYGNDRG